MTKEIAEINVRILRAERIAIGKSLIGQWTKADDEALEGTVRRASSAVQAALTARMKERREVS